MTIPITLQDALDFMIRNDINDPEIYSFLSTPLDIAAVTKWLKRIDRVNTMTPSSKRSFKKAFEGKINRLKGKYFEQLAGLILQTAKPFTSWHSVQSTTNELDWLIQIGPSGQHLPAMREWGTHLICESKLSKDYVNVTWVGKLNTVLQTHGASVGILISSKGMTNRGRGAAAKMTVRILSAMTPPRTIISFDLEDIRACTKGTNFLQLLSQRYVEARAGADRLRLIKT